MRGVAELTPPADFKHLQTLPVKGLIICICNYLVTKPQNHELQKSIICQNISIPRNLFSYFVKTHFRKKCSDLIVSHCTYRQTYRRTNP